MIKGLIALMRPRQWVKNGFVLAPLVFSGLLSDISALKQACLAMVLFCVVSSITYVINDIHDIENDRKHPVKSKSRPLAAGLVNVRQALLLLALLVVVFVAFFSVIPKVAYVAGAYLMLTFAYTFYLKQIPVVDIFTLSFGFVMRVYAGAVAIAVPVSNWMFITTLCLALYLAAIKRRQELHHAGDTSRKVLRAYSIELVERYAEMSAAGALVFYSLFVMSARPELIVTVPIVLFGLFRYWYIVEQEGGGESPTDVLLKDWQIGLTLVAWLVVSVLSMN